MSDCCESYLCPGTSGQQTGITAGRRVSQLPRVPGIRSSHYQKPLSSVQGQKSRTCCVHGSWTAPQSKRVGLSPFQCGSLSLSETSSPKDVAAVQPPAALQAEFLHLRNSPSPASQLGTDALLFGLMWLVFIKSKTAAKQPPQLPPPPLQCNRKPKNNKITGFFNGEFYI